MTGTGRHLTIRNVAEAAGPGNREVDAPPARRSPEQPFGPRKVAVPLPRPPRIVGRAEEVRLIVELLAAPWLTVVMLVGRSGVGRSRLLDAVRASLCEAGLPVRRLPVMRGHAITPDLSELAFEERTIVVLDDAHLLDDAAASGLHDLAVTGRIRLLLALPLGAHPPEPIAALCGQDVCERVVLDPLTREACDDLVTDLVGHPVDAATAGQVHLLAGGLPRRVVDLVRGLVDGGLLVPNGEAWSWVRPDRLPDTLLDHVIVGGLLELTGRERQTFELLACAGTVSPEILVDAGAHPDALERLEQLGALAARRSGRRLVVEIPDPLLAMAARQRIGQLRRRHLGLGLARAWEGRGCRRAGDVARAAGFLLDAGGTPSTEFAERGARQAIARGHYRLAERLARSALQSGGGTSAACYLAQALSSQGRAPEAESALRSVDLTGAGEPALHLVRAAILRWELSDRDTSQRLVEDVLRTSAPPGVKVAATLELAGFFLHDGRFQEALDLADQVLDAQPPGTRRRGHALTVSISALCSLGRAGDALDRAREALRAIHDPPPPHPPPRHPALPEVTRHQLAAAVVRAYLIHGDPDSAEDLARRLYGSPTGRTLLSVATWASFLGEVALLRGRVRSAVRLLSEARAAARRCGVSGLAGRSVRVLATKNLARALVMSGEPEAAGRVLAEIAPADLDSLRAIDLWTGEVAAEIVAATSHADRGVEAVLRTAARTGRVGAWGVYVPTLHQAVRLGGAAQLPAGALDRVVVQGPLLTTQVDHIRAAVAGQAEALMEVAEGYVRLGAHLFAAEAATDAAQLHESAGRDAAARRASSLAQACAARCEDLSTSLTALLREPVDLTPRQREIARLAAQGLPSKAIARRLVVSVRTVDNYLGQVYRKLGIANRSELAAVMALAPAAEPMPLGHPGDGRPWGTRPSTRTASGEVE